MIPEHIDKKLKMFRKETFAVLEEKEQRGARACADVFIFRQNKEKWDLHIIEFKKTINTDTIGKSRWQFTMGIYNARGLAGFLGMEIENICLYSGFRKDSLTDLEDSSLISLRVQITGEASEKRKQWLQGKCQLTVDGKDVVFLHQKIKLDQNGHGSITL